MLKLSVRLRHFNGTIFRKDQDVLVCEMHLELRLSSGQVYPFSTIPQDQDALVVGYMKSAGLIVDMHDIVDLQIEGGIATADLKPVSKSSDIPSRAHALQLEPETMARLSGYFQEKSFLYKDTSISQSAAIATKDHILWSCEDIDTLNAVDKVIGMGLLQGKTTQDRILMVSGKVDEAVVKRALLAGCAAVTSRLGPTNRARDLANRHNILLIGFARGKKFNVYD